MPTAPVSMVSSPPRGPIKWAFTTRRVPTESARRLIENVEDARPGDLVLAEVETIGQHKRVHLREGRPAELYPGDLVVLCVGARYAPDQFEAHAALSLKGADLVAAGGLIGTVRQQHDKMNHPTRLRPLGLLADAGRRRINVRDHALGPCADQTHVPVVAVLGSSMNAGKTTAVASLVHGLSRSGLRVGAAKITGTGALADVNAYLDAGACQVLDFTDAGFASTYQVALEELLEVQATLISHLQATGCDVVVIEVADGVYQRETAALVRCGAFGARVDAVLYAAGDALSAVAGVRELEAARLRVVGVSGVVSASPLASQEAGAVLGQPLITRDALRSPEVALELLASSRAAEHLQPAPALVA